MLFYTSITFVLFICTSLAIDDSKFVDNLPKCSIRDNKCLRKLYQTIVREIGKHGLPELDIPPVDPFVLKNVSTSIMDFVELTMVDGVATGVTGCVFNDFQVDLDRSIGTQAVTCDITLKGLYSLSSRIPILGNLVGNGGIHGEGYGKAKIENLYMTWNFTFYPERHEDGEIYLKCLYKDIKYNYDVKGKASFAANNIYLGNENISGFVINYMNENWKFVIQTFTQTTFNRAMELYFGFAQKFFESVPARKYITDDLTSYLKN